MNEFFCCFLFSSIVYFFVMGDGEEMVINFEWLPFMGVYIKWEGGFDD